MDKSRIELFPELKLMKVNRTEKKREFGGATLILGDAIQELKSLKANSFDLAIADPPYGASTKAQWSLQKNHNLNNFGGAWQLADHEWDMINGVKGFRFLIEWLSELKRLVKPTGSIWIHSTYHNSGIANIACQILGLEIINEVVWYKRNAFPNLSNTRLTASHETILWVHTGNGKRQYRYNYEEVKKSSFSCDGMKQPGKQLRTVWDIPNNKEKSELTFGKHPTQKPIRLISRLFLISGKRGGKVLVPFVGSGSEMIAALNYGMLPHGYEVNEKYFDLATKRIEFEVANHSSKLNLRISNSA